jgi:exopolyphosphatase / guanosine-5'-triphosphate,3'-diphosphate pyrophosphatase
VRIAAVDIGTNSVRLLVAEVADDGSVRPLERLMRITRLGQGVDANRRLAPEAIERTLAVLREYRTVIDRLGADRVRATATSAARDATNRDDFFTAGHDALGTELELIPGEAEAALSFRGATQDLDEPGPYLVIDIGGGSTEFVVGTTEPTGLVSVDIGCVRITEQFLHSDPPAPEELSEAVSVVRDHLADVKREVPGIADVATVIGLAGTVTTVAAIELGLPAYDPERIHHFRLGREAVEDVFRTLATESASERRHNPGLEAERVDVIVGGAVVLASVMRVFDIKELLVSEADILDGLVLSQIPARNR